MKNSCVYIDENIFKVLEPWLTTPWLASSEERPVFARDIGQDANRDTTVRSSAEPLPASRACRTALPRSNAETVSLRLKPGPAEALFPPIHSFCVPVAWVLAVLGRCEIKHGRAKMIDTAGSMSTNFRRQSQRALPSKETSLTVHRR